MNSITIAGNLGRDAELRYLQSGDAILSFSVGDNQGKDKPTIWWHCSIFGKRAEALSQYLKKGQAVAVSGSLSKREYTDRDGAKREALDLRVSEIALQGGQAREQASEAPRTSTPARNAYADVRGGRAPAPAEPRSDFADDDIPF